MADTPKPPPKVALLAGILRCCREAGIEVPQVRLINNPGHGRCRVMLDRIEVFEGAAIEDYFSVAIGWVQLALDRKRSEEAAIRKLKTREVRRDDRKVGSVDVARLELDDDHSGRQGKNQADGWVQEAFGAGWFGKVEMDLPEA